MIYFHKSLTGTKLTILSIIFFSDVVNLFVCKLKNTDKKIELPITISKFVNAGLNDLKDFYFLPSFYFPANASIYEWINYFNIITIENVLPGGN